MSFHCVGCWCCWCCRYAIQNMHYIKLLFIIIVTIREWGQAKASSNTFFSVLTTWFHHTHCHSSMIVPNFTFSLIYHYQSKEVSTINHTKYREYKSIYIVLSVCPLFSNSCLEIICCSSTNFLSHVYYIMLARLAGSGHP